MYIMHNPTGELINLVGFPKKQEELYISDDFDILSCGDTTAYVEQGYKLHDLVWDDYMFAAFLRDESAFNMYVTGAAGTGKTTQLAKDVQHCIDINLPYVVCAYTHKACNILRSKLPPGANVKTLHSFLGKRPTINQDALHAAHVTNSSKVGDTDTEPKVMFLDERSMVGEKDWIDIGAAQDPDYTAVPKLKVVWLGDEHQLPPVGDQPAVKPEGDYQKLLTKQWRNDNPLQIPLNKLISFMEGTARPEALAPVEGYFIRNEDITEPNRAKNSVVLAYTNKKVQELNIAIQGRSEPEIGDAVFSPTTQQYYLFNGWVENPSYIDMNWCEALQLNSKYKTLEYLVSSGLCRFAEFIDDEGDVYQFAIVFGHYDHKSQREELEQAAVEANNAIQRAHPKFKPAGWAKFNPQTPLARTRAKAWRDCLSFKDCVICMDFTHAMTVHKSQGSTFETVYIDTDDLAMCANRNFDMYLKLMYVAISRASTKVITN